MSKFFPAFALAVIVLNARAVEPTVPTESNASPAGFVELKSGKVTFLKGTTVKIGGASTPAKLGDTVVGDALIETGAEPVTQVTFEDGSVLRLGANSRASFSKDRVVRLEQGFLLFSAPEGKGGITILGGEASGKVTGSTVMGARDSSGNFSFLILEASSGGSVTGGAGGPVMLGAGEMTTIRPGSTEAPEILSVHVDAVRDASPLFQQIAEPLPGDQKVVGTTLQQADEIQGEVKLLSGIEDYKLTEQDPESLALAMICGVGTDEVGSSKNILLRSLDTAAGAEPPSDQGSVVAVGSGSGPTDARQSDAAPLVEATTPAVGSGLGGTETAAGGGEGDLGATDTAAGGGGGADTQAPLAPAPAPAPSLPPVSAPSIPDDTTPA